MALGCTIHRRGKQNEAYLKGTLTSDDDKRLRRHNEEQVRGGGAGAERKNTEEAGNTSKTDLEETTRRQKHNTRILTSCPLHISQTDHTPSLFQTLLQGSCHAFF